MRNGTKNQITVMMIRHGATKSNGEYRYLGRTEETLSIEGKNHMELKDDTRYQAWIDSNGTLPFPDGESREDFILRCARGFERMTKEINAITKQNKSQEKTIATIVHGGTIMALLSKYYGGDYFDYQVANGKGYICTLKTENVKIVITELKKI